MDLYVIIIEDSSRKTTHKFLVKAESKIDAMINLVDEEFKNLPGKSRVDFDTIMIDRLGSLELQRSVYQLED